MHFWCSARGTCLVAANVVPPLWELMTIPRTEFQGPLRGGERDGESEKRREKGKEGI